LGVNLQFLLEKNTTTGLLAWPDPAFAQICSGMAPPDYKETRINLDAMAKGRFVRITEKQ